MSTNDPIPGEPLDEGELQIDERPKQKTPRRFKVLLHNDDFTTQDFVVRLLLELFGKTQPEAVFIMLIVHRKGVGVAGVYPRDLAETKVAAATRRAREEGHPLLITMEAE